MADAKNRLQEETSEPQGVSLKAVDVLQQTFTVKFRGYDPQDVDAFLEIVAREIERLAGQNTQLADDLRAARQELALLRKKEENVNSALLTVQKLSDETHQKAQAESVRLLEKARSEARDIIAAAQAEAQANQEKTGQQRKHAEAEAQTIIDAARQEAERILNAAHDKASQRHAEADTVKSQAQDQARSLLETTRGQVETMLEQARAKSAEVQDGAARIRSRAEEEARTIIEKARAESSRLDEGLLQAKQHLQDEITRLRQNKIQFETSFRALIETHLKLMEDNDGKQPG